MNSKYYLRIEDLGKDEILYFVYRWNFDGITVGCLGVGTVTPTIYRMGQVSFDNLKSELQESTEDSFINIINKIKENLDI